MPSMEEEPPVVAPPGLSVQSGSEEDEEQARAAVGYVSVKENAGDHSEAHGGKHAQEDVLGVLSNTVLSGVDMVFKYWSHVPGGFKVRLAIQMVLLLPFLLYASVEVLAMTLLVPLALGYELLEHHVTPLWLLVLLFINFGGVADEVSDVVLLAEGIWVRITGDESVLISESASDDEAFLLLIRVFITMIGCVPSLILAMLVLRFLPKVQTHLKKKFPEDFPKTYNAQCRVPVSSMLLVVGLMILWKVAMVLLRTGVFCYLLYNIVTKRGHIPHGAMLNAQAAECVLMLDVLFSSIPLGVLTMYEVFILEDIGDVIESGGGIFELIKISALMVDLVGVAHLLFLGIVVPTYKERQRQRDAEHQPLLAGGGDKAPGEEDAAAAESEGDP